MSNDGTVRPIEPFLPTCSVYTLEDFRADFGTRGIAFNLSNAGDYIYDVRPAEQPYSRSAHSSMGCACAPPVRRRACMASRAAPGCGGGPLPRPLPPAPGH